MFFKTQLFAFYSPAKPELIPLLEGMYFLENKFLFCFMNVVYKLIKHLYWNKVPLPHAQLVFGQKTQFHYSLDLLERLTCKSSHLISIKVTSAVHTFTETFKLE